MVSATVTSTDPSSATTAPRAMPNSTMSLPSSGSMTPRSTASTSSAVGRAVLTPGILPVRTGETRVVTGYSVGVPEADLPRPVAPRLAVLKALGDNTRYAIYLELARSPRPLATAEIAETLGLHPNTVRPHLERMRDVGLLDIETEARGTVGRPQHRYSLAADAPLPGAGARHLPRPGPHAAAGGGHRRPGRRGGGRGRPRPGPGRRGGGRAADATRAPDPAGDAVACLEGLMSRLDALGFDPAVAVDAEGMATVAFTHCPFRELAETHPEIVCSLHQGLVEGFVSAAGGAAVDVFHPLTDRTPCQVDLALSPS